MSDAAPATPAAKATKKKASKPKKPSTHPKYSVMIKAAITSLKERGGSSRQAIAKYIAANYKVTDQGAHLKMALKRGVAKGDLKQVKGTGASGSFRMAEKAKSDKPKKTTKKAKKPKSPKMAKAKKPAGEKKTAKKPKAKKAAKSPAKKTAKPKKAKTPKKAAKPKKAKSPKAKKAKKPAAKKWRVTWAGNFADLYSCKYFVQWTEFYLGTRDPSSCVHTHNNGLHKAAAWYHCVTQVNRWTWNW